MGFWQAPYDLMMRDYVAASLMVLAGILQHGLEAQRWWFKRLPENKGMLHTGGLFRLARGINHTGHILRDFGSCLFAPNPFFFIYVVTCYALVVRIVPATVEHMRKKYGEAYEKYEKTTPALFIPGVC
jgi:steroid 5-alpha reductase family enzyme